MVRTIDIITAAARRGMILRTDLTKQALREIDREALETEELKHWDVLEWDGQGDPPYGERERWDHDKDGIGRATQEAFKKGHMVYFLMHDGKLHHYQPYQAYVQGHLPLHPDPDHVHYWKKAAQAHIASIVESRVDGQIYDLALERALELHEQANIPVGMAYRGESDN